MYLVVPNEGISGVNAAIAGTYCTLIETRRHVVYNVDRMMLKGVMNVGD